MRVAYLSQGNSSHSIKWVNSLAEKKIEVHFITQDTPLEGLHHGVSLHQLPFKGGTGYFLNAPALRRLLARIKPDILHSNFASGYGTLGRLSGFKPHLLSVWGSDIYILPKRSTLRKWLIQKNLNSAEALSATSLDLKKATQRLTYRPVEHIPFGVDTRLFQPAIKPDDGHFNFGITKSLEPVYGHQDLLKAFKILLSDLPEKARGHCRLKIAGKGSLEAGLKKLAHSLQLSESVEFTGFVKQDDMPRFINSLDVLVTPSHSEAFGVSALEASACGKPVIATRVGGLSEVIIHEETGLLLEPGQPSNLAEAMRALYDNAQLRATLGQNGRRFAETHYAVDVCTQKLIDLYEKMSAHQI